jgi:hypothetical protein
MSDEGYLKRAKAWMALQVENGKPPGTMLRPLDIERWKAWRAYFAADECPEQLKIMWLCDHDQWASREPGTNSCWIMVPSDYPHEFDPKGATDARA